MKIVARSTEQHGNLMDELYKIITIAHRPLFSDLNNFMHVDNSIRFTLIEEDQTK